MNKLLFGLAALATAGTANASIIPTLIGSPTDLGSGEFQYDYSATLAADQGLVTGGYFTLYDVAGFIRFGALPAGWMGSTPLLGKTPSDVLPTDDAMVLNTSFTYSGAPVNYGDGPGVSTELGTFSIVSTSGAFALHDFTSQALKNGGAARGTFVSTIGKEAVSVPGDNGGGGSPGGIVPEPASWTMMIVGFGLVGAARRRNISVAA